MPGGRFEGLGGEWRQLTVMFCDVVGSTALAGEHDPELYREVLRSYQTTASAIVQRYEGHVANYIGDGILAYFGYPRPHEDDAGRAVKAGLDLLAEVGELARRAEREHGFELAVRAAIHTGMVVRAEMGPPESPDRDAVVGETPSVAARLQDHARPGALVISGDTARLVRGHFELESLGPLELRGVAEPVEAFEVTGEAQGAGRLETEPQLSPFVGRERERERLGELWRKVVAGAHAAAAIRGEPGIGKSRLLEELRAPVLAADGAVLSCRCSAFHLNTHLYPVRRMAARACGIEPGSDPSAAAAQARAALARRGLERHLPLLGSLLGIAPGPDLPAPELAGAALREATLEALIEWIEAEAARSAAMLSVDDLQWADPSTLELLGRLIDRAPPGLFLLLACRADFELPWPTVELLELAPLGSAELERIAVAAPEAGEMAAAELERIVQRSDGVPLFLEEQLRVSGQPAAGSAPRLSRKQAAIPPALLDPLLARLAAPGVDLGLVQTAACIGNDVERDLLATVADLPEEELEEKLGGLIGAGLLTPTNGGPPGYRFRHQLLRELAYDTQLTPARMRRHARIADALRLRAGSGQAAGAGRLAQHLEQAGRSEDAIVAHVEAARIAQSQGALAEATEILDHALGLAAAIEDEQARPALELAVRRARGLVLLATKGYAAPEAVHEQERCLELARSLEAAPELSNLIPVWSYYLLLEGDVVKAEEVLAIARRPPDAGAEEPPLELFTGHNRFFRGDIADAAADLGAYLDSPYAGRPDVHPQWPMPNDPTVAAWALLALANQLGGDPQAARSAIGNAEARAARLPFPWGPYSVGFAKTLNCLTRLLAHDFEAAVADVVALRQLGERHGFTAFVMYSQLQEAIFGLRRGGDVESTAPALALWRAAEGELWVPSFLTEVAKQQLADGDLTGARASLREAEAISGRASAGFWAAETTRVLGETRLAGGDAGGVEDLRAAAELAARQGALVFELRARTSLMRVVAGREERDRLAALTDELGERPGLPEIAGAREALAGERSR